MVVLGAMPSWAAISLFEMPSANRCNTWSSRRVSDGEAGDGGAGWSAVVRCSSRHVDESQRVVEHRAPRASRTPTHLASERLVTEPVAHETDDAVVHVPLAGRDAATSLLEMIGERSMEASGERHLAGTRRQRDDDHHARVDAGG